MRTGDLRTGIEFLRETGSFSMLLVFALFSAVGFLGMNSTAALTKRFGAITSAITSTVRKGLTLVLSYILFPRDKFLTIGHIVGAGVFLLGLIIRILAAIKLPETDPLPTGAEILLLSPDKKRESRVPSSL